MYKRQVATLFFYCKWYLQTRVPDVIRVGTEEELQVVDLGFKQVSVQTLQRPQMCIRDRIIPMTMANNRDSSVSNSV